MQIKKIFLETARLNELNEFYHEMLGLPITNQKHGLQLKAGNSDIFFKQHAGSLRPFYHFAFNIPFNKIESARQWLKKKTDLIWINDYNGEIAEFFNWKARSIYFLDPAGNIVELIGRQEFVLDSENDFGPDDFLSVSEIGIVYLKEVYENRIAEMMEVMELDYFARQKPLPGFSAIGNDEGLLIAVYNERNWYPTSLRAAIFPLEIEILNKGKLFRQTIS